LDVGVGVLLALGIAQLIRDLFAGGIGGARVGRIIAGILDILPVFQRGGILRLGLRQRVGRFLEILLGPGFAGRAVVGLGFKIELSVSPIM